MAMMRAVEAERLSLTLLAADIDSLAQEVDAIETAAASRFQLVGFTSATYTGAMGSHFGVTEKCQLEFLGARMCTLFEAGLASLWGFDVQQSDTRPVLAAADIEGVAVYDVRSLARSEQLTGTHSRRSQAQDRSLRVAA